MIQAKSKLSDVRLRGVAAGAMVVVLLLRGWRRIWDAGLWAEDGVYLKDALERGIRTLAEPYSGYFQLFPKGTLWLAAQLPVGWIPPFIAMATTLLYVWSMSSFAEKRFRTLLESDRIRVVVTAGFGLLPGLGEMLGNACNLHRALAFSFLLLTVQSTRVAYRKRDLAAAFLIAGSAGEVVAFLPLLLLRIWIRKKDVVREWAVIGIVCFWAFLCWCVRVDYGAMGGQPKAFEIAHALLASYLADVALGPVVGYRMTLNLFNFVRPLYAITGLFLTYLIARDIRRIKYDARLGYLAIGGLFVVQILNWIVRPGVIGWFLTFAGSPLWWGMREAFTLSLAGYWLWCMLFARISERAVVIYLAVYLILAPSLKIGPYGDMSFWPGIKAQWERNVATGCPPSVVVPVFPLGWVPWVPVETGQFIFEIRSGKSKKECEAQ